MINIFDLTPVLIVISCITCVGASSREILKAPNEKCPEGYHVLDDNTKCVPCSNICYKNMDRFTEANCKRICPKFYDEIIVQKRVMPISTTAPPGEWPEHHTDYSQTIWILCVLSAMMLIVIVVVVINRQSLCRWINIHYQQVYNDPGPTRDTQPIEEKNPDDRYTELVPSGH